MERLTSLDFIAEYKRLLAAQSEAQASKDADAIDAADHEMKMFLLANANGRTREWMASRKASAE